MSLFDTLSKSPLMKKIFSSRAPRWAILAIDLFLVFLSCFFIILANNNEDGQIVFLFNWYNLIRIAIVVFIYGIMCRVYHTYYGIIRYTGTEDTYRVFIMTFSATLTLLVLSFIGSLLGLRLLTLIHIIEIGLVSFSLILLLRLSVKELYNRMINSRNTRKSVIVLGSAIDSIVLANALKNEVNGAFNPVALLSLKGSKKGDDVNGIPIVPFNLEKIDEIFADYNAKTLIFLATHLELMKKGFADRFLEAGIELLLLNQIEEFDQEKSNKNISQYVYNIKIEDLLGREPIHTDNPKISRMIKGKVVMITGAAGSIGSELVRQVAAFRAESIVLYDQAETPMHSMQLEMGALYPSIKVHLFVGDIQNKERVRQAYEQFRPDFVFHAAAYKHVPMMENNPTEAILTNVRGTRNVADLALEYGVEKFVMISTDKAVNPTNVMGCSKRIAEIYVQSLFFQSRRNSPLSRTAFITTRFGNVLGSNGSVVPLFKEQIAHGGPVTITHKDIIRYFMTIPEACNLVLEAGCMGQGGEIFIFDMGKPVKIYDLAKRMILLSGLKLDKDIKIVETGLRPGEKLYEELLNDKEKTTATYHKKIMIAQVRQYEYNTVVRAIEPMIEMAYKGDAYKMVKMMKMLVPEYKSKNSAFEQIDREIEQEMQAAEAVRPVTVK